MNKKLYWKGFFVVCVVAFAAYQFCMPQKQKFLMANVEALTNDGDGDGGGSSTSWSCWSSVKDGDGVWVCGNPCVWKENKTNKGDKGTCVAHQ